MVFELLCKLERESLSCVRWRHPSIVIGWCLLAEQFEGCPWSIKAPARLFDARLRCDVVTEDLLLNGVEVHYNGPATPGASGRARLHDRVGGIGERCGTRATTRYTHPLRRSFEQTRAVVG